MITNATRARQLARSFAGILGVVFLLGCESTDLFSPGLGPAAPVNFNAFYRASAVHLSWELGAGWNGEPFRIWGKRIEDPDYFLIAEVTSCADGLCSYSDANVSADITYVYYVTSVDQFGAEVASAEAIEVRVPLPVAPPIPDGLDVVPLDGALFITWSDASRLADDFSFYRVYLEGGDGSVLLLGETDSEGFLDSLVENGNTYGYVVSAVDEQGHESELSTLEEGTPRPDFHGELLYAFGHRAAEAGFRFQDDEATSPILSGDDPARHFRLEVDAAGWKLVPAPGVQIAAESFFTTALRCGPAADAGCVDVRWAPDSGYGSDPVPLLPEFSYVVRVGAQGGGSRYGLVRVAHLGFTQDGAIAIFDWAYQLQIDNPNLVGGMR